MTEVRRVPGGGHGLFATREFRVGDVVIDEEEPLVDLSSLTPEEETELKSGFAFENENGTALSSSSAASLSETAASISTSFRESIGSIPEEIEERNRNVFRGLVQMGAWYATFAARKLSSDASSKLVELYVPSLDRPAPEEAGIVQLARQALQYLRTKSIDNTPAQAFLRDESKADETVRIMLVWACNSFEGGRIYERHSRINHSCDPNAIVQVRNVATVGASSLQSVRAVAPIVAGDEITIPYLGTLLYGDVDLRRSELRRAKHFTCRCDRCCCRPDAAASLPCLRCHPRRGRLLDEDVQYDDDRSVNYMVPVVAAAEAAGAAAEDDSENAVERRYTCSTCGESFDPSERAVAGTLASARSVSQRVAEYLRAREAAAPTDGDDNEGHDESSHLLLEEHATLASSVCGALHWTTNLLLLLQLDRQLKDHHRQLLIQSNGGAARGQVDGGDDDEEDALERIASCADLLERLVWYTDGLGLRLHRGHALFGVTVGLARALVGLGDAKSTAYAVEWLERVDPNGTYASTFESAGMQKVVATLRQAHSTKRPSEAGERLRTAKSAKTGE